MKRGLTYTAIALTAVMVAGTIGQVAAERRDRAAHPAPGDLVELADGRRLHLLVTGRDHDGPTVVLEAGMGGFSSAWGAIQPAVAEHATVVSYDRAGLGWSDAGSAASTAETVVDDLHEALRVQGFDGPYVLVGHSLGGLLVRAFAAAHPDDVAALVLVDPSHERQHLLLGPDYDNDMRRADMFMAVLQGASRLGITRLWDPLAAYVSDLPEPQLSHALAAQVTPAYIRTYRDEMAAMQGVGDHVAALDGDLGDLPVRILTAGSAPNAAAQTTVERMNELRAELAALSSDATYRLIENAEHVTIVTKHEHAAEVTNTIIELIQELR